MQMEVTRRNREQEKNRFERYRKLMEKKQKKSEGKKCQD